LTRRKIWRGRKGCCKKKAAAWLSVFKFVENSFMGNVVKYLVDENGKKTSVLIPVKMWETLNNDHKKMQAKIRVLTGIQSALKEISEAKRTGKKLPTLRDILREN
jgi:hypothetical protein